MVGKKNRLRSLITKQSSPFPLRAIDDFAESLQAILGLKLLRHGRDQLPALEAEVFESIEQRLADNWFQSGIPDYTLHLSRRGRG